MSKLLTLVRDEHASKTHDSANRSVCSTHKSVKTRIKPVKRKVRPGALKREINFRLTNKKQNLSAKPLGNKRV